MRKIRKGDQVVVIAGKDKGKRGQVLKVLPSQGRVVVEGVALIKRHVKPNPMKGVVGGVVEKSASIDVSNVAIFNPSTQKRDRVSIKILEDGKKVRVFKSTGEVVGA